MALTLYTESLREFDAAIAEIRAYVNFASAANHLRPWAGRMVDWNTLDADQRTALTGFVSQKDYHVEVGFNGVMVSLAGTFEQFVRRLIRDGIIWINKSIIQFEKLQEPLRHQNLFLSGRALATVHEPPAEITYDYELLCKNLGTCRAAGGALVLNADAFAVGISNTHAKRIDESLLRIGVEIDWDVFGRNTTLQRLLGETRVRDTANQTQMWLKEFIVTRNRIAHSAVGGIQISETQLTTAIDVLAAFAPTLAQAVEEVLKKNQK